MVAAVDSAVVEEEAERSSLEEEVVVVQIDMDLGRRKQDDDVWSAREEKKGRRGERVELDTQQWN